MRWVRPEARPLLTVDDHTAPGQALTVLESELNAPRRLLGGTVALLALLLAGLAAAAAQAVTEVEGGTPAVLLFGLVAVALGGVAAWTGLSVIRGGRAVLAAYLAWSRRDSGLSTGPAAVLRRGVAGPWLFRELLAGLSFIATMFAAVVLVLPLADVVEITDPVLISLTLGGPGVVGFGTATWCLLSTDLRAVWAHGLRVGRGRETRGRTRS